MRKPAAFAASIVFALVAVAHLVRAILGTSIEIGGWAVPHWLSVVAVAGAGALSMLLWRERGG